MSPAWLFIPCPDLFVEVMITAEKLKVSGREKGPHQENTAGPHSYSFRTYCSLQKDEWRNHCERGEYINSAMRLSEGKTADIRTTLRPHNTKESAKPEAWNFTISPYPESGWVLNCEGQVRAIGASVPPSFEPKGLLRDVRPSKWYDALASLGIIYGPLFKCLSSIQACPKDKVALGGITLSDSQLSDSYLFHPVALDACLQLSTVALARGRGLGLVNCRFRLLYKRSMSLAARWR